MKSNIHDECFACVSHLPQALLYCLSHTLGSSPTPTHHPSLRLINSPIGIWADIFIANCNHLVPLLKNSLELLTRITQKDIESAIKIRHDLHSTKIPSPSSLLPSDSYIIATILTLSAREYLSYAGSGFLDSTACLIDTSIPKLPTLNDKTTLATSINKLIDAITSKNRQSVLRFLKKDEL